MERQWPPFAASAIVWEDKKAMTRHIVAMVSSRGKIGRIDPLRVYRDTIGAFSVYLSWWKSCVIPLDGYGLEASASAGPCSPTVTSNMISSIIGTIPPIEERADQARCVL
jgi:hypothetical protein